MPTVLLPTLLLPNATMSATPPAVTPAMSKQRQLIPNLSILWCLRHFQQICVKLVVQPFPSFPVCKIILADTMYIYTNHHTSHQAEVKRAQHSMNGGLG